MTLEETRKTNGRRWVVKLVIAALIMTGFAVGPLFAGGALGLHPLSVVEDGRQAETQNEWTPVPVELPREWRWERKAITFDHMFRQK